MAATYNASVANLVDPLANSPLNSPSHAGQHTEIIDALQTLGVWTAYTPTWTSVTVGNGTVSFSFTQFNKVVHVWGSFQLGSTSAVTGVPLFTLPVARETSGFAVRILGTASLGDFGTATYTGIPISTGANDCYVFSSLASGTYAQEGSVSATVPFTWTTNDAITVNLTYRAA